MKNALTVLYELVKPYCNFMKLEDRESVIKCYFRLGLSNKEILSCLAMKHGYIMSMSTLKRTTKKYGLVRRLTLERDDLLNVVVFIANQCNEAGKLNGYRWMHAKCIAAGYVVMHETVRLLRTIVDCDGFNMRRKRRLQRLKYECAGQNAVWHCSRYISLIRTLGLCLIECN
jgi:hypothetical protein